ncbi:MAG: glycosyltransferase family 4 protein [Candidatus Latescibacteria bacterium]|nr:glycosyltransferase family 4 protein [Candidatus Latescibacterota bacterium]
MKVLFVTQYGMLAASSRTRVFQYLPYLQAQGIQARVITVLPDRGLGGSQLQVTRSPWSKLAYYLWAAWRTFGCGLQVWWVARDAEVLFIQKVIFPAPVRWLLRWRRPPVVYDFDDAIFTTEVRRRHWLAAWKQRRNAAGLPAMLRLADHALVENEYTAAFAASCCSRVSTITGPIDTQRYGAGSPPPAGRDEVVLGWIGSATTLPYLELIRAPLARLGRRFPHVRLRVIGAASVELEGLPVEARPWSLEGEVEELRSFDIGLMPVPDDPWTRGKGGYKLLQYMASGLPVVTSPVGINCQIVRDGETGFWARTSEEWEERLARLIADPALRRGMGQRGRAAMEAGYALELSSRRLGEILRQVAGKEVV